MRKNKTNEKKSLMDTTATSRQLTIELGKTGKGCPIQFVFNGDGLGKVVVEKGLNKGENVLERVFGTGEPDLISDIIGRSVRALIGGDTEHKHNAITQALADYRPNNAIEAKLCAQAHVLFSQGMQLMSYANDEAQIAQQEHCLKNAFKCLRLHNETVLVLDKLRRGGEQKVIVQHVNVNDGGQAAVMAGSFQGGGGKEKMKE